MKFSPVLHYEGNLIFEIKPGFRDYFGEGLKTIQEILNGLK